MTVRTPTSIPRDAPYTYATWLSRVMAGESQCHYAGWFRSHFSFKATRKDPNLDTWTAHHTAMVHDTYNELKREGFKVYLEDQNMLQVRGGGGAILAGKPDIVAIKGDTAVVLDCKTGQPKTRDTLQVRLYMYLLGEWSTHPARMCRRVTGEVRYDPKKADPVLLPHAAADGVAALMRRYMQVFTSSTPPEPVPSLRECRYCELSREFCAMRASETKPIIDCEIF